MEELKDAKVQFVYDSNFEWMKLGGPTWLLKRSQWDMDDIVSELAIKLLFEPSDSTALFCLYLVDPQDYLEREEWLYPLVWIWSKIATRQQLSTVDLCVEVIYPLDKQTPKGIVRLLKVIKRNLYEIAMGQRARIQRNFIIFLRKYSRAIRRFGKDQDNMDRVLSNPFFDFNVLKVKVYQFLGYN